MQRVSVIIPTLGYAQRAVLTRRAVDSVLSQDRVRAVPIVVVNGAMADPELVRELRANGRVRVEHLAEADLPGALRRGRELVDTPFFTELDDDDLLLPCALAHRVEMLERAPESDAVITNGIVLRDGRSRIHNRDIAAIARDPWPAMLHRNWLLPGSWLCRNTTTSARLFEGMPKYLECTFLAMKLLAGYRPMFSQRATVVWNVDSFHTTSDITQRVLGQADAVRQLLQLQLPPFARRAFELRVAAALHSSAQQLLDAGHVRDAWRWHLQSLVAPGGWRYATFTRHLVTAVWRR